jgi:hypothetical protein
MFYIILNLRLTFFTVITPKFFIHLISNDIMVNHQCSSFRIVLFNNYVYLVNNILH